MNFLDHTYFAYPRGVTKKICEEIIEYGEGKMSSPRQIFAYLKNYFDH